MTATVDVARLYDGLVEYEVHRLAEHPMERELTFRSIQDGLAAKSSNSQKRIADVGGGPGCIAFRLADAGHVVDLRDLTPGLIEAARSEQAKRVETGLATLASLEIGNALDQSSLAMNPSSYDAVLLLGPLYHIMEEDERVVAVENALNLAADDGGLVYCAFISVAAHLRDVAVRNPSRLVIEGDFYATYFNTGKYEKYKKEGDMHVQSFHTHAADVRDFFRQHFSTKAELIELRATEGILGGGLDAKLEAAGTETVNKWAKVMYEQFSTAEEYLGCADHLLAVIKKKTKN